MNHDAPYIISPGPATVLVVDDQPHVRDLLSRWLSSEGYRCAVAEGISEARKCLEHDDVSLITIGIQLSGPPGSELLQLIRDDFPEVGVIVLTDSATTSTALQALTHRAWGYLLKPVERDEFLFQINNSVQRQQLLIENRVYTRNLEAQIQEQVTAIHQAQQDTIHRLLTASRYRDEETGAHIHRTGLYSRALAEAMGWPPSMLDRIRVAAPMHDVGKIGIPDAILQKPGKLTCKEYEIMKMHTEIGAQMLSGSTSPMLQMAEEIARCHHERWDGTGYPSGMSGANIPESARIVTIVDVFDALTHDRVYRAAMDKPDALKIMRDGRGTHFEPSLFDLFMDILPGLDWIEEEHPDEFSDRDGVDFDEESNLLTWGFSQPAGVASVVASRDYL